MPPPLFITWPCVCVCSVYTIFSTRGYSLCVYQSCSECSEPTLAQSLCTLCNKWLCYQCTDAHQHQRATSTSQYTDLHQQQRPSAAQCPDMHQRGSSSLPPTGQGKHGYLHTSRVCYLHSPGQYDRLLVGLYSLSLPLSSETTALFSFLCPVCLLIMCQ